jgi:hypothetical protein
MFKKYSIMILLLSFPVFTFGMLKADSEWPGDGSGNDGGKKSNIF